MSTSDTANHPHKAIATATVAAVANRNLPERWCDPGPPTDSR